MKRDRRQVLTTSAAVAGALLAGCVSGPGGSNDATDTPTPTATPTATPSPESRFVTDDAVVDYPGMVDGEATVEASDEGIDISYDDPAQQFRLVAGFEGDTDPSELRAGRDLAVSTRAGFIAPVYDPETEAFVYQVFANEAFVEFADWNFVTVQPDGSLRQEGPVPFERAQGRVYAAGISPGEIRRLFVVDRTAETIDEEGPGSLSGLVLLVGQSDRVEESVPNIQFNFEHKSGTERLTITHEGGDNIPEEDRLVVRVDDRDWTWTTPVSAGDRRTVTIDSTSTVRVIWESESGDRSATLAEWTGPDA